MYWIEVFDKLESIVSKYETIADLLRENEDIELIGGIETDDWVSVEYEGGEFGINDYGGCLELDPYFQITGEWRAPETLYIHQLREMFGE